MTAVDTSHLNVFKFHLLLLLLPVPAALFVLVFFGTVVSKLGGSTVASVSAKPVL